MCVCVCVCGRGGGGCCYGYNNVLVWKVHLRVKVTICNLEAPGFNPDLISTPGQMIFVGFLSFSRLMMTWYLSLGDDHFFLLCNLFFTLSYHQSMLSYGLCRYLHLKRTQTTRTVLIIFTYRMQQWQLSRNFLRQVSS